VRDPKKALDAACKRLKFPHFSPRSLRRCFITRASEKGVGSTAAARIVHPGFGGRTH
jgi:hypothetical protein